MESQCRSSWTRVHEFFPEEYDAGASSSTCKWRTTQRPSTHFEVILNFKDGISYKYLENIVIKEVLNDKRLNHRMRSMEIVFSLM
jgi:hypothetical protein